MNRWPHASYTIALTMKHLHTLQNHKESLLVTYLDNTLTLILLIVRLLHGRETIESCSGMVDNWI